jgi:hypothetical protein
MPYILYLIKINHEKKWTIISWIGAPLLTQEIPLQVQMELGYLNLG